MQMLNYIIVDDDAHLNYSMFDVLNIKAWLYYYHFQIPHVVEMYGSTEGTVAMINNEDHVGAVGFISRLFPILPINVIKLDENGKKRGKFDKKLRNSSYFAKLL